MKNICTETDGVHQAECEILTGVGKVSKNLTDIVTNVSEETAANFRISNTMQEASMTLFIN
jgi:hypothetical protein